MKLKKTAGTIAASLALVLGGLGVNTAIAAPSAEAGKAYGCFVAKNNTTPYATWCEVDYDWMEEVFLGQRDGLYKVETLYTSCSRIYKVCYRW